MEENYHIGVLFECSTPSGIKGTNASSCGDRQICWRGAQRLPASKEQTRPTAKKLPLRDWVLNAFRHQRKKRSKLRTFEDLLSCAQRLPASKEETRTDGRKLSMDETCAQRLPASKEETLGIREPLPSGRLCAQRLPASKEETLARQISVRRMITRAQRLPASKEETHLLSPILPVQPHQCSTPSGIKGRNASPADDGLVCRDECSTPSGIKGRNAPTIGSVGRLGIHLCSTPSGIKGRNALAGGRSDPCGSGAQRLPASKEETLADPGWRPVGDLRCSTPSGIKGRNATIRTSARAAGAQCSTPSGIKGTNARQAAGETTGTGQCSTPSGIKGRNALPSPTSCGSIGYVPAIHAPSRNGAGTSRYSAGNPLKIVAAGTAQTPFGQRSCAKGAEASGTCRPVQADS